MKRHRHLTTLPAALIVTAITCVMLAFAASAGATTDIPGSPEARIHAAQRLSQAATAQPTIVHETIAAHNDGNAALPIALAASALLVAIAGSGYSVVLATRRNRPTAGRSA